MRKSLAILITAILFFAGPFRVSGQATPTDTARQPQTFAMIMGISNYKYVRPLTYADKDAEMFRDYLKSPAGGKVKDDNIFILLNEQALNANFLVKGFAWLKSKQLQRGDRLFIYLAGHGDAIDEDQFFFLTYDCNPAGDKNNYLVTGTVQLFNLKKKIANESAKGVDVFFIMDACRSNELPGGTEGQNFLNAAISEKRAGEIIMLATGAGQESLEDASIGSGHGLFTYYLVDGLNGMADTDGEMDNKVTFTELKKYIDKNVPSIAQERFKRKQVPYLCCDDNTTKTISIVDTGYLQRWLKLKSLQKSGPGNSFNPRGRTIDRGIYFEPADTQVIATYNMFTKAVRESKLTGKESAEYYYQLLERNFPGNSYTIDAQSTLAVEFINFAQSKINLYLECKDAASIQKIRAQIDEEEKTDEINTSLNRMDIVARQEFYEVGNMLEKAIGFIMPDDPDFANSLKGRMYFFKARGYFGKARRMVDINSAFQFAYTAYAADRNAAYILNTLSSLHMDNNRLDSAIHYAKKAIEAAPRWRYPYVTLAVAYRTLNKADSAVKYYRKAIDTDPTNSDAYVDLGHFYFSTAKKDSAIAYYTRALQIDPRNVSASNNIGWVLHSRKKYDEAIKYFKQSIAVDPRFINAYNGLSKSFFEMKLYDSALIYYTKAFEHYQDKSIVNVYIGNFYRDLKQYDSAKVYYRLASQIDPTYEETYNNLGRASFALKEYDSAIHYYRHALQVNPYSAYALINIGMVHKELKQNDSTYNYFQQAISLEPTNPQVLNSLGVLYGTEKVYDSAKKYFRRALLVKPDYNPASKNLIKIFTDLNQLDSIANLIRTSSFNDPGSVNFFNELGQAFLDLKRYDSARIYYRGAIRQDPANPLLLNNMGRTLHGLKQYDSARVYYQRAMHIDPENPIIWNNLANAFGQLKMVDSAAFYFKKQLLKRTDATPQAYLNIAGFYDELKAYDTAIVYYKKALELDSKYVPALNNIGTAFMKLELPDSAFKYYRMAVNTDPQYESASLNLGLVYHSLEKYDSAIVYIQNAIRLDPAKAKNYYQLACSYALSDQPQQAILYLRQAYERGYKNFDALLSDPDLLSLRNFKEFQDLLDKYVPNWKNR
jgi:tetratricopeptide (TPR) repeat protein